ncbi:MAG: fumarylacetoacetate hydrolase [Promethearchaeia archaeon]|nr:MAG: fumarylacetoacetate hydrolase [Candidatus Lokiarchaeia archaeon]
MKFATLWNNGQEELAVQIQQNFFLISQINAKFKQNWPTSLDKVFQRDIFDNLCTWLNKNIISSFNLLSKKIPFIPYSEANFAPLFRNPSKIWGIGLNYRDHAADLEESVPSRYPASFIKGKNTIIGFGEAIKIPIISERTTGEAELGIVIKTTCKNVPRSEWKSVVAGFVPILDMTAEDILRQNPRYLTLCKNFDTFFSFGPILITPDEIADVSQIKVSTVINSQVYANNIVANMTFPPDYLVSFHSKVMTLYPGDIISTGTPRAVKLSQGDILESHVDGFPPLVNIVEDLKNFS